MKAQSDPFAGQTVPSFYLILPFLPARHILILWADGGHLFRYKWYAYTRRREGDHRPIVRTVCLGRRSWTITDADTEGGEGGIDLSNRVYYYYRGIR